MRVLHYNGIAVIRRRMLQTSIATGMHSFNDDGKLDIIDNKVTIVGVIRRTGLSVVGLEPTIVKRSSVLRRNVFTLT